MKELDVRDLEPRRLQALAAIVRTGTFGRAAQDLGYTQSAVSQQIAALERAVGEPLFDRVGGSRRPVLTPVGEVVAAQAAELLRRADDAVTAVQRFRVGAHGRIDIGTFQSVSTAVLPGVLARLRREMAQVEIGLFEHDDDRVLTGRVDDGRLDVTFAVGPVPDHLAGTVLFEDPIVVVARPQDVDEGPVSAAVLRASPLIGEQPHTSCQRLVEANLARLGVPAEYVFRSSDNAAVIAMVVAGMGMTVRPLLTVDEDDARLAVRPVEPPLPPRSIVLAWRRDRTLSPAASRVVELAVELTAARRAACAA